MRRLPVFFLIDTSGSMKGEPIEALNNALTGMISSLRSDPQALESVWICIITFDIDAKIIVPLTELSDFQLPIIQCPRSGPTSTGKALMLLREIVTNQIITTSKEMKGDWRPLLFLFTDGEPSDVNLYKQEIPFIKQIGFANIVACAVGPKCNNNTLKLLTDTVIQLETADSATLKTFFMWVSQTIDQGNKSLGVNDSIKLPPVPNTVHLII